MTESQKLIIFRFGFIILLVSALYGSTLKHGFVWDDNFIIVDNPLLENLSNIPQFFLSEDTIEDSTGYYRPVTYISFALDRAVWGVNPAGYHFTNLVLHILAVLLFYAVIKALFEKERLAFVTALIFATHPLAGETVNFLAGGRNTLLSACFALLSLLCYIRKKHIPALISFTVAIFSKEFALLLPVVFLLYDYRLQRVKINFRRYLLYLIPVACYLILRSCAVQKANFLSSIKLSDALMAPYLVARYALNMLLPFQLKVLYVIQPALLSTTLCATVIVILLGAVIYYRKNDQLLFSACLFFLFLLPVINIIPLHTTTIMADRYAYFSLMGFALCLATAICNGNGRFVTASAVTICAVYLFIGYGNSNVWKDNISFFTRMTTDAPGKFDGFQNLGMAYYHNGSTAAAVQNLNTAVTKPDIPVKFLTGNAYIFWKENMLESAEKSLIKVTELAPRNPEPYLILMLLNDQKGNKLQAQLYRDKAKEIVHDIDETLKNKTVELCRIGETIISMGRYKDAETFLWQALKINPGYVPALVDMGRIKAEQGDYANAIVYLNKALAIDTQNTPAHYNLSIVYKMQGKVAESLLEKNRFKDAGAASVQKRSGNGL